MSWSATERLTETQHPTPPVQAPASAPPPPPVAGFEILKLIGQGSYGSVWLGKERVSGVYRAIKTFAKSSKSTEIVGLCEFQRRALYHPHLVQILVLGEYGESYYVVMELADDIKGFAARDPEHFEPSTLDRLLRDRGAMPVEEALANWYGMLQGIDYLHRHGLVHRDIKPSNVLFVNGVVKLCDFGLVAPGSRAVERAGTQGYWRPDGPTDRESDLYASTKVAFQMLTASDVSNFADLPADLARATSAEIYRGLRDLLGKGCSSNPSKRFSSAQAMTRQMERFYQPPVAEPVGSRTSPRRRQRATTMVLLAALGITLFAALWMSGLNQVPSAFSPSVRMTLNTFPQGEGNPNVLIRHDPNQRLKALTTPVSTDSSSPKAPARAVRFAKLQVVCEPESYMLVFWIAPSGYVYMAPSTKAAKTLHDPQPPAFRSLDGDGGNFVICALLNDRPFRDADSLRDSLQRLATSRSRATLPPGSMRILSVDSSTPVFVGSDPADDSLANDFGLLAEIRSQFGSLYPVAGIELPLARSSVGSPQSAVGSE